VLLVMVDMRTGRIIAVLTFITLLTVVTIVSGSLIASHVTDFAAESQIITVLNVSSSMSSCNSCIGCIGVNMPNIAIIPTLRYA
jgi:hypothetical protein